MKIIIVRCDVCGDQDEVKSKSSMPAKMIDVSQEGTWMGVAILLNADVNSSDEETSLQHICQPCFQAIGASMITKIKELRKSKE